MRIATNLISLFFLLEEILMKNIICRQLHIAPSLLANWKAAIQKKETFTMSAYNIEQYCQWKRWKSYYGELETTHYTQCLVLFYKFIFPVKVNSRSNRKNSFLSYVWWLWIQRNCEISTIVWIKCEFSIIWIASKWPSRKTHYEWMKKKN